MQSTFNYYPRASYGLQNLGPGIAQGFWTAGYPDRLINGPGARPATKAITNPFEFNPNTLKDAIGFKISAPQRIIHPNLQPTVNFSLPTQSKRLDPVSLREDINEDYKDLKGADLLAKIMQYIGGMYEKAESPFDLSAQPFQSLVTACKRLNLNVDPQVAGLPRTIDNNTSISTFTKATIWLLGADQTFDKQLKPGYILLANQRVPVSSLIGYNGPVKFILDLPSRRASVGLVDPDLAELAAGPQLPDVGDEPAGAPNLADGRDGKQNVASQDPVEPAAAQAASAVQAVDVALAQAQKVQDALEYKEQKEAEQVIGLPPRAPRPKPPPAEWTDRPARPPLPDVPPDVAHKVATAKLWAEIKAKAKAIKPPVKPTPAEAVEEAKVVAAAPVTGPRLKTGDEAAFAKEIQARMDRQKVLDEQTAASRKQAIEEEMATTMLYLGVLDQINASTKYNTLFTLYTEGKQQEAQVLIEQLLGAADPGSPLRQLAEDFKNRPREPIVDGNGSANARAFIEELYLIMRMGPKQIITPNNAMNKAGLYRLLVDNPAAPRQLRLALGKNSEEEVKKVLNTIKARSKPGAAYINVRRDYSWRELGESILRLYDTQGQIGIGPKRRKQTKRKRKCPY